MNAVINKSLFFRFNHIINITDYEFICKKAYECVDE